MVKGSKYFLIFGFFEKQPEIKSLLTFIPIIKITKVLNI